MRNEPDRPDVDDWLRVDRPAMPAGGVLGAPPPTPPGDGASPDTSRSPASRDPSPEWADQEFDLLSQEYRERASQLFRWAQEGREWDEVKDEVWDMFAPAPPEPEDEQPDDEQADTELASTELASTELADDRDRRERA